VWSQQVVFFKGDTGTKVKTPGAGRMRVRESLLVSYHGETLQAPSFPSLKSMPSLQQNLIKDFFCIY
jgi:hypothetical protein